MRRSKTSWLAATGSLILVVPTSQSLWSLLPTRVRWSLLPAATSAVLVGAGEQTASAIAEALDGSVGEIAALLLLVNLVLALWVFHHVLELEVAERSQGFDVSSRLISFAAIFVAVADLLKTADKYHLASYVGIFGVPVLFYLMFVPCVLTRLRGAEGTQEDRSTKLIALLRMAAHTAFGGVLTAFMVALFTGVFFAVFNEGVGDGKAPILALFGGELRNEIWMINPIALAIPALQLYALRIGESATDAPHEIGLDQGARHAVLWTSIALIIVMAVAMLKPGDMVLDVAPRAPFDAAWWMAAAEGVAALVYALAFALAETIVYGKDAERKVTSAGRSILVFGAFGMLAGAFLVLVRWTVSSSTDEIQLGLIALHGAAFSLAFAGYEVARQTVARRTQLEIAPAPGATRPIEENP